MVLTPVRYSFVQKFSVPVDKAFEWATDYDPEDYTLMGLEGRRKVDKLSEDAYILHDSTKTEKGWVEKTRLVRINPERHSFVNTHIEGPTLHSQFWYEFFPEKGGKSRLEFTGLLLYPGEKRLSKAEAARIAAEERRGDSALWKVLAKSMEDDYAGLAKAKRTRG
jgi:hypothetical protein